MISKREGHLTGASRQLIADLRMQTSDQLSNMIAPYHGLCGTLIYHSKAAMCGKQNMILRNRLR